MYVYIDRQIDMQNVLHHIYYILFMCVYHIISNIQNVLNVKILFMYVYYRICIPTTKGIPLAPKKKRRTLPLRMLISTFVQGIGFRLLVQGLGFSIQLLSLRFRDIYIYIYAYIHKHIHIHVYTHIYMRVCLCSAPRRRAT